MVVIAIGCTPMIKLDDIYEADDPLYEALHISNLKWILEYDSYYPAVHFMKGLKKSRGLID